MGRAPALRRPAAPGGRQRPAARARGLAVHRLQHAAGNRAVRALLRDATAAPEKPAPKQAAPAPGVQMRAGSKLNAAQLVAKIKASKRLPGWLGSRLAADGNRIRLTGQITPPSDRAFEFHEYFEKAFGPGDWTVTTAAAEITVKQDGADEKWVQRVVPDLEKGERFGSWVKLTSPELEFSQQDIFLQGEGVQYGQTLETQTSRTKQREKVIVVVTRFHVTAPDGATKDFESDADNIAESFIHELSAHAGRLVAGRTADHGDKAVDRIADEVGALFRPADDAGVSPPSRVTQAIGGFLAAHRRRP